MKTEPDHTIEEALLPPSTNAVKQEQLEEDTLFLQLSNTLYQTPQPEEEKKQQKLEDEATPQKIRKLTLDQLQDDHLLQVPSKIKGLHVGTLLDGWTPYDPKADKSSWYIRECLNGLTTSFSQIPESIFFSKLAHVSPALGLRSSWIVGLICAVIGGRPAMINGSSGAYAMMIATFVGRDLDKFGNGEGIEYLFPSVIFAGILNIIFSFLNIGDGLLTLLSSTIVIAFCNSLAFFMADPLLTYEFPVGLAMAVTFIFMSRLHMLIHFSMLIRTRGPTLTKCYGSFLWRLFA